MIDAVTLAKFDLKAAMEEIQNSTPEASRILALGEPARRYYDDGSTNSSAPSTAAGAIRACQSLSPDDSGLEDEQEPMFGTNIRRILGYFSKKS